MIEAPYKLDFLFIAETYDGQIIRQPENDVSATTPGRSTFYDVLQHKIKRFSLSGKGMLFTIDLTDGHYEVNGNIMHTKLPPGKCELKVIYYRQVEQRLVRGVKDKDVGKTLEPIVRYYIGWQANYKGKNYKFELGVD